jgi:hypothetical protein
MDSLLAGTLILPWKGHCAGSDVQRRYTGKKHSGHRESHSGIGRKPFVFPPESLFAFSPESCSSSPRNRFRDHPGIPVRLAPESAATPELMSGASQRFSRFSSGDCQ